MGDRISMPSATPADRAEVRSDRVTAMPEPVVMLARRMASDTKRAIDNAYTNIRDADHLGDILNEVRDGDGRSIEFDSQLARIMREFPEAARIVATLPHQMTDNGVIALVAVMQALARIERLLYVSAYADELATMDKEES